MKKSIMFKHEKDEILFFQMSPILIAIAGEIALFCHDNEIDFVITDTVSTVEQDKKLNRISSSHREGRAFDMRTKGIDIYLIYELCEQLEGMFGDVGAISKTTGKRKLCVLHSNGNGEHLHIQIDKKFKNSSLQ